jgi:hypothetical protein
LQRSVFSSQSSLLQRGSPVLPAVAVLWLQGTQRNRDSRKIVFDAMEFGRVESSALTRFERWCTETLPQAAELASRHSPDELAKAQMAEEPGRRAAADTAR